MKLTCWGAAGSVTGSMHLLETDWGEKILIDCGLYYEKRKNLVESNKHFPFNPKHIDTVILTHAHIDHSGNLPNLVRQGFSGNIYCTYATKDLTAYLLEDSLNIQLGSAKKVSNKRKKGAKKNAKINSDALYSFKNIKETMEQMIPCSYSKNISISDDIEIQFSNAGHILGAASVLFTVKESDRVKTIGFTGDLGNTGLKLMKSPANLEHPDYIVTESTYGGRFHTSNMNVNELLLNNIKEVCVNQGGKLIIPAFSVGRTQAVIFTLNQLYKEGKLPAVKIYTDSPLAIKTTRLYERYPEILNIESQDFIDKYGDLFEFDLLHTITNPKMSDIISSDAEPCVIISAAGMVEGGRIQQHVRMNISNPNSRILIAGFCAEGTLGYQLLQGLPEITINGKSNRVLAEVLQTDGFSAHLDHNGLTRFIKESAGENTKRIFLVHADPDSALALQKELKTDYNVEIAERGVGYQLD